jgi:hypothetical protein
MHVRLSNLGWKTRIHRAVLATLNPHLLGGVVRKDHVASRHAQGFEVRAPERRRGPDVEHFRDADAQFAPTFQGLGARPLEPARSGRATNPKQGFLDVDVLHGVAVLG